MIVNFNPGPSTLPPDVIKHAQREFADTSGIGYGIVEASHRGPDVRDVFQQAQDGIRQLLGLNDEHAVLFLQGGACLQFAMVPMNLRADGAHAEYADTGVWSNKAIEEARRLGAVEVIATSADSDYDHIPDPDGWSFRDDAAYVHITSNNTITGTQYSRFPDPPDAVPLVADMSSDILTRPVDAERFGLIYAGAQKNIGIAGVTLVIIRRDLAERAPESLPVILRYGTHMKQDSLYNTPPVFAVYMMGLMVQWIKDQGGLEAQAKTSRAKADLIYDVIDADDFYRGTVRTESRSAMNICFRLSGGDALEKTFLDETAAAGLIGLKGHRSVGGVRASLYNGQTVDGAKTLADFMVDFRDRHG